MTRQKLKQVKVKRQSRRVKSLQESLKWLKKQPISAERDNLITTVEIILKGWKDPNEHALIIRITKENFIKFNEFVK